MTETNNPVRQNDSVEVLFEKIIVTLAQINDQKTLKDRNYAEAISAVGTVNRSALVRILGFLRGVVRQQAEDAAELDRFNVTTQPVRDSWQCALDAWSKWVAAEMVKNPVHQAQLVMSRAYWMRFSALESRISFLWDDGPDGIPALVADIEAVTAEVSNHYQGNWCQKCGAPIADLITPKNGGRAFKPTLCVVCKHAEVNELKESEMDMLLAPVEEKRKIAKPGSASKRHTPENGHTGRQSEAAPKKGGKKK